tara:strand:- start:673 stop:1578 length:906 start_codon:yes stop_codon:yes gene_type:complete
MDYNEACQILGVCENSHTEKEIIKAYHKLALRFHPDKFGGDGTMFKRVKEAKDVLLTFKEDDKWETHDDFDFENIKYSDILLKSLKLISPKMDWDRLFIDTTFKSIIKDCKKVSLKVFDNLQKDKAIEIYSFISQYNDFFPIEKDILDGMKNIIKKKIAGDNIIVLNPGINDLMNDSIYKLEIGEDTRYVPLWHHELYFDVSNGDLIVKCEPELEENIIIDDDNNIFYTHNVNISNVFMDGFLNINIGGKKFNINANKITLSKEKQIFTFKNSGISKNNLDNLFDTSVRSDIYICLLLSDV